MARLGASSARPSNQPCKEDTFPVCLGDAPKNQRAEKAAAGLLGVAVSG